MKSLFSKVFFVLVAVALIIFLIKSAGTFLVKNDLPKHSDATLILMGSIPDRILQTADLFHEGLTHQILIVEENMGGLKILRERGYKIYTNSMQASSLLNQMGIPDTLITIIPGYAKSTMDEAIYLRDWLRRNPQAADTLTIVSSSHHMRRASLIFNKVLNKNNKKYVLNYTPSKYTNFNAKRWYTNKEDIQKVISEYIKIAAFLFIEQFQIPNPDTSTHPDL